NGVDGDSIGSQQCKHVFVTNLARVIVTVADKDDVPPARRLREKARRLVEGIKERCPSSASHLIHASNRSSESDGVVCEILHKQHGLIEGHYCCPILAWPDRRAEDLRHHILQPRCIAAASALVHRK